MRNRSKRRATRPGRSNGNGSAAVFARALAQFEGRIVNGRMQRTVVSVARLLAVLPYNGSSRIKEALVEDRQGRIWRLSGGSGPVGLLRVCDVAPGNRFAVTTQMVSAVHCERV